MFRRQHKKEEHQNTIYATGLEFCRIFQEDMRALYLLAFLLTRDHEQAEACFTQSMEDCFNGSPVFVEWARTWARRVVIMNAIRLCVPRELDAHSNINPPEDTNFVNPEIAAVLSLPAFERFVFVVSVLERYSDQECSLFLDCGRRAVHLARIRALEQIASQSPFDRQVDGSCACSQRQTEASTSFVLLTQKI